MEKLLTVEKRPFYEQVAEKLRQYLIRENYKPGDKLPSEPELAGMFDVGRSSVREAVKTLAALGIVDIRRREGTIVQNVDPELFIENLAYGLYFSPNGLQELHRLRSILELGLTQYLLSNPALRDETSSALHVRLRAMEEAVGDDEAFALEDLKFHETLFVCSQSDVINKFVAIVSDFFAYSHQEHGLEYTQKKKERILQEHRRFVEALERGDASAATGALLKHFSWFDQPWHSGDGEESEEG